MRSNIRSLIVILILFLFALGSMLIQPASAAPQSQVYYYTPTPQPDGRVLYTVKEGDSCISIALLNNITEEQLRSLNNLAGDDCLFLIPGQQLLLDVVEQQPTAGPSPTPTSILPS
jgi:LysM repeat protein